MLLVSCCNKDGGIFAVDELTGNVTPLCREETRGIDVRDGLVYSAGRSSVRVHELLETDKGLFLREIKRGMRENDGRHGVKIHDRLVYVVDAINDTVNIFDSENLEECDSITLREGNDPGRCHTNDLFFEQDGSFIFSSFSSKPDVGYHNGDGCIRKYISGSIELLKNSCLRPHSPIVKDGILYFCDSGNNRIVCGDDWQITLPVASFLRGLCITEKWIYVGLSINRSIEGSSTCGICRVDRNGGELHQYGTVFIPLPANEVYGIVEYCDSGS